MLVVLATCTGTNVRRLWALNFRGIEEHSHTIGNNLKGLTDCIWMPPGCFDVLWA